MPSSSTLTRFLGPRGAPSISVWEDANRQCPVCQQSGFSSRSLSLHVNDCLDARSRTGVGKGTALAGEQGREATTGAAAAAVLAEDAQGRSNPSSYSARAAGDQASGNPHTGNSGNRKRVGQVSRGLSRTTKRGTTGAVVVDSTGEQVPRSKKTANVAAMAMAAKTDSAHQGPPRTAERSGASTRVLNYEENRDVPSRVGYCLPLRT